MTLILSNDDVERLLSMTECLDALEDAYVELAEGRGVTRVRSDCLTPTGREDAVYGLKSMDGVLPKQGIGAVRIGSDMVTWPRQDGKLRRVKVPAAPGDRYVGLVLLFSSQNCEPLAIFPDGVMQRTRVGATNGLAAKVLAREDAKCVGILGSGWQAGTQLTAICAVRDIETIRCFSPNARNRTAFSTEMSATLGIEVTPVDSPESAVKGADVVMCASSSIDNIFFEPWIEPGMHLSSIKRPEIETKAILRADKVVIHTRDATPMHIATKGLELPERTEGQGWAMTDEVDMAKLTTLPEIIAGKAEGRTSDEEVTCFLNNLGMGFQFAAAGAVLYRKAKEAGAGHDLPTDWFTEDVHP
jgi:ornithine cyclodeaminase/alanine dehydrogenase-like protein (mu-crystallin family)